MYALTKNYRTKAMAVNAVRMTATNKGWTVLTTEQTAEHVLPQAEGYVVNNTTLNLAMGFITEAEASVANALAENAVKEAKAPKLQGESGVEKGKRENLVKRKAADKAPKGTAEGGTSATRCTVVNGARRPLRGKTLLVWEVTERLQNQLERVPTLKEVHEQLVSMDAGFNKTTTGIQYYACKAFNGWTEAK